MQIFFSAVKIFRRKSFIFFNILSQNIDCGYTARRTEAFLTSTHNLGFGKN